jgi:hypothetical protein
LKRIVKVKPKVKQGVNAMLRVSLTTLALLAALPAAAQEQGGMQMQGRGGMPMAKSLVTLDQIQANRGCPMSMTTVTAGVNKAFGTGSSSQQQLGTTRSGGSSGCRPLVSTQVVTGANLALGRGSSAGQTITSQGPGGVLSTNLYTRGYNLGYGPLSSANQHLLNTTGR